MRNILKLTALVSALLMSETLLAQPLTNTIEASNLKPDSIIEKFKPNPQKSTRIDYDVWDSLLEEMVLLSGPSARKRMSKPQANTGTRMIRGHQSPYRLEGNRIPYSQIKDKFEQHISDYKTDLEKVGTQIDIATLSKNEQLAFWLNLHNVSIIEQLGKAYPLKKPRFEKVGPSRALLHDAKIVNINNTALSLRDIREKIVYPHWKNPKVIYGFYLGDIGSPSIQNSAFTANNLTAVLDRSAEEFVNSLRGFHRRDDNPYISEIYKDVAEFYFPNFDMDVKNHMSKFMREDVKAQLNMMPFKIDRYDTIIADLTAGQGIYKSISPLQTISPSGLITFGGRSNLEQYVQEIIVKRRSLERKGLLNRGTVIIEDIETESKEYIAKPDIDTELDK